MNPGMNETGFNVPQAPELPAPVGVPETASRTPEQAPAANEKSRVQALPAAPAMPAVPMPLPAASIPQVSATDANATTNSGVNTTPDDTDLIDKEWVERAKKIVERYREDPHKQSNELGAFKAEYLQKRYGKTIKLDT